MADNIAVTPGSGATIAADDIGGALHQRVRPSQVVTTEDLVTKAYSFFTGSFQALSLSNISTSLTVFVHNDTDANLEFNWDNGANTEHIVLAKTARLLRVQSGSSDLYGKYSSAPTEGNCHLEVRE